MGSMLPDFAGMLGARLGQVADPEVRAGVELHHRSDAAFHAAAVFLELVRSGRAELEALELRRGPARAVAHVGVELLLDATLADDDALAGRYVDALACADSVELPWSPLGVEARWKQLRERLRQLRLEPERAQSPFIAERVGRALAGRPRLALTAGEVERVASWIAVARPKVNEASNALWDELRQAMDAPRLPRSPQEVTARESCEFASSGSRGRVRTARSRVRSGA